MNGHRRASLSFLLMAIMVLSPFMVLASAPAAAEQKPADMSPPGGMDSIAPEAAKVVDSLEPSEKLDSVLAERMKVDSGPFKVRIIVTDRTVVNTDLAKMGLPEIKGKEITGIPTSRVLDLTKDQITALVQSSGIASVSAFERPTIEEASTTPSTEEATAEAAPPAADDYNVDVVHGAKAAWDMGFTGDGVKIAVIDTGMDMAHPDLQGQQARYNGGAYDGWPIAYDDMAAYYWSNWMIGGWVADTTWISWDYGGYVDFMGRFYDISALQDVAGNPVYSQSGEYRLGWHTDQNLAMLWGEPIAVLVVDANVPYEYDTVYVDVTDDYSFSNDKACTKGDEISYYDFYDAASGTEDWSMWNAGDGFADLSGGMIYWISDGMTTYPGSDWIYGAWWTANPGDAVAFVGEFYYGESHGTMTSSAALAVNKSYDGLLAGMAPGAKLICIPFTYDIINSWIFAALGADGTWGSGDEANIVSNSYGWSDTTVASGWDLYDAYAGLISLYGEKTLWCWSAGNGGPGYGTVHSTVDYLSVHVGAGTTMQYRYYIGSEPLLEYTQWGDVAPFSNSGPTRQGKLNAEIIASGMYSLEPAPLNGPDYWGYVGDGWMHFQLGSGTSHSTPTVAGGAALGYDAYNQAYGDWPYIDYAKAQLMAAADDMHFDPLKQGAGWLNASKYCQLMSETDGVSSLAYWNEVAFMKAALYPGDVYGQRYEFYPNLMLPGQTDASHIVSTFNYNGVTAADVGITSKLLLRTGSDTISVVTPNPGSVYIDILPMIPAGTDLLKVTMMIPFEEFDPEMDYTSNVEYWLEMHDWVDLNNNSVRDGGELFRYSVDGSNCNYNQIMLKDPVERSHDGLFARIRPYIGATGVDVTLQLDYYQLQTFPWMTFRMLGDTDWVSSLDMTVAPWSEVEWEVNVTVPGDAPVGTYAAAIYIDDGSRVQDMPVVINVAASDWEFQFGGASYFDTPYNNNFTGEADKGWRFEVGDWRVFWCEPSTTLPGNTYVVATVNWTELPTDVNVHVVASMWDPYGVPQWNPPFGPGWAMGIVAQSDEMYMGAGIFGIGTNTGGPQEVVAADLGDWYLWNGISYAPWMILTRSPVMAGHSAQDTLEGYTRIFSMNGYGPGSIDLYAPQPGPVPLEDSVSAWYDVTVGTPVEVKGSGVGPLEATDFPWEPVYQDSLSGNFVQDLANADYTRAIWLLQDCTMLQVSVWEQWGAPDIDLGVWYDQNEDGIADLSEPYWYVGIAGSSESLTLNSPADGQYLIKVLGYTVTDWPGYFGLRILQGVPGYIIATDLESPAGSGYHEFNVSYSMPHKVGTYYGYASFGFMGADDTFKIPFSIVITDIGGPEIQDLYPGDGHEIGDNSPEFYFRANDHVNPVPSPINWGSLQITLDGRIDVLAWSSYSWWDENFSAQLLLTLSEGTHYLDIYVEDIYGNGGESFTVFTINTVIDYFFATFLDPDTGDPIMNGATTSLGWVDLSGYTEANANIALETPFGWYYTMTDDSGGFMIEDIWLVEGVNAMSVYVDTAGGIEGRYGMTVVRDSLCMLWVAEVESPTNDPALTLSGWTDAGASVTVDGDPAMVNPDGTWTYDAVLAEGLNSLLVEAMDAVGNTASKLVDVTLDTTPPSLVFLGPDDGSNTSEPSVTVYGTTDPGATVWVNGVVASDGTADWSAVIPLLEGWNSVTVTAADELGNSVSETRAFEYIPPVYVTPEELAAVQALLQDQLDSLTAALAENVSALQAIMDALEAALNENISDLQGQIDEQAAALAANVTDLQGQIDALTASLASNVAQLQALIDALDDALAENRSALDADIAALQTQIADLSASLAQDFTTLQDRINATRNDMTALNITLQNDLNDLQDQLDGLNQTTQDDINTIDEKASDTDAFASMLMYLTLVLFAIAVILVGIVWYVMNGRIGGRSSGSAPAMEEVDTGPPSEVEKEFEALEKEIKKDEL